MWIGVPTMLPDIIASGLQNPRSVSFPRFLSSSCDKRHSLLVHYALSSNLCSWDNHKTYDDNALVFNFFVLVFALHKKRSFNVTDPRDVFICWCEHLNVWLLYLNYYLLHSPINSIFTCESHLDTVQTQQKTNKHRLHGRTFMLSLRSSQR